jgi:hypothetical protein
MAPSLTAFRLRNNGNLICDGRALASERNQGFGMPCSARCCAFLLPLLASPALAQADRPIAREQRPPADFRISASDFADRSQDNGLIAAASLGERVRFGVGRFGVADRPRARTHLEPEPRPTDVRRHHRGAAAIGFSFSF